MMHVLRLGLIKTSDASAEHAESQEDGGGNGSVRPSMSVCVRACGVCSARVVCGVVCSVV